jgi:hypothetical protein
MTQSTRHSEKDKEKRRRMSGKVRRGPREEGGQDRFGKFSCFAEL